jgi:hypothetical protein
MELASHFKGPDLKHAFQNETLMARAYNPYIGWLVKNLRG